jgi:hypothetical protein
MRLSDLKPRFYKHSVEPAGKGHGRPLPDGTIQWGGFPVDTFSVVENIADADRVSFLCPKCFSDNGGEVGTHRIAVDFIGRGTPDDACMHNDQGQPVRWSFQGSSLEDLTLGPSIAIIGGCAWHGFVEQGGIRTC